MICLTFSSVDCHFARRLLLSNSDQILKSLSSTKAYLNGPVVERDYGLESRMQTCTA